MQMKGCCKFMFIPGISSSKIKKAAALLVAISMLTAFTACGNDKKSNNASSDGATTIIPFEDDEDTNSIVEFDDDDDDVTTTTTTNGTTTTTLTTATTAAAAKRDNSYKVSAQKYSSSDGKVNISYPQISGLYDSTMQDYYNKLFKSDFSEYISGRSSDTFNCEYQVTLKTADLLSIVFRCSVYMDGAAHPTAYAYAYTIDLESGGTLVPSAVIDSDSAAKNFVSGKSWTLSKSVDGVSKSDVIEYFNQYSTSEIKDFIIESDVFTVKRSAKGTYSTSGNVACRSYLDGSSSPIFLLDVTHALGDYVEVEFN